MHEPIGTETSFQDQEITIQDSSLVALAIDEGEGGRYVYLADASQNKIHFISQDDLTNRKNISVAGMPIAMDTTATGDKLVVATDGDTPSVHVIDVNEDLIEINGSIPLDAGSTPTSIYVVSVNNENHIYVGIQNGDSGKAILRYNLSSDGWPKMSNFSNVDGYIAGRSHNRSVIYTSDQGQASEHGDEPVISKWDITNDSPQLLISGAIFGVGAKKSGWVLSVPPENNQIILYGRGVEGEDGSVFYDGMAPLYDANSFIKDKDFSVEYQPIAAAVTFDGARVIFAHNEILLSGKGEKHDKTRADIHIFDIASGEEFETDAIKTQDFVHTNGLAIGNNRTIYALLGRETATKLGVYVR